jgi:hypothetical protein
MKTTYIQCLEKVFIPFGVFTILLHYNLQFKLNYFGFHVMDIHKIVQIDEVKCKNNLFCKI